MDDYKLKVKNRNESVTLRLYDVLLLTSKLTVHPIFFPSTSPSFIQSLRQKTTQVLSLTHHVQRCLMAEGVWFPTCSPAASPLGGWRWRSERCRSPSRSPSRSSSAGWRKRRRNMKQNKDKRWLKVKGKREWGTKVRKGSENLAQRKRRRSKKEEIAPIHTGFTYACWPDCEPFKKTAKKTFIKYPKYCVYFLAVSWWLVSFIFFTPQHRRHRENREENILPRVRTKQRNSTPGGKHRRNKLILIRLISTHTHAHTHGLD